MTEPATLHTQRQQWQHALEERPDRFGAEPSTPAQEAATLFEREGVRSLLELGGGQGRDSLFFAHRGLEVTVLDYAPSAVETIRRKARESDLGSRITAHEFDVREPLPFSDTSFDACFSHMLFCMALTLAELDALSAEVRRVLRPGGLHVYTARTTDDPDYGKGTNTAKASTNRAASSSTSSTTRRSYGSPPDTTPSTSSCSKKAHCRDASRA